jgi:hypothetical protein
MACLRASGPRGFECIKFFPSVFIDKGAEYPMIQAIYKGIEIEMELHQQAHEHWKCDYTLIKHPDRTETIHHGDNEFATFDLARDAALQDAHDAINQVI